MKNWYHDKTESMFRAIRNDNAEQVDKLLVDGKVARFLEFPHPPARTERYSFYIECSEPGYLSRFQFQPETSQPDTSQPDTSQTWLCIAAQGGHCAAIKALLDRAFDINQRNKSDLPPLSVAIMAGQDAAALMLIQEGCDIEASTWEQPTPLYHAVSKSMVKVVSYLVHAGANVLYTTTDGQTPAHLAARNGSLVCLGLLALNHADLNVPDKFGQTPLHLAALHGHLGVVTWLLARKMSLDCLDGRMVTPVTNAVIGNHVDIMEVLIKAGCDVWWVDRHCDKETLLHVAAKHGSLACLRVLIKAGLGVNSPTVVGETPLDSAIVGHKESEVTANGRLSKSTAVVRELLQSGAKPTDASLVEAVRQGHTEIVRLLVASNANSGVRNEDGENLLHIAARSTTPSLALVRFLARHYTTHHTPLVVLMELEKARCMRFANPAMGLGLPANPAMGLGLPANPAMGLGLPANPASLMGLDRSILRLINTFLDFSAWVNMPTHCGCATPVVRFLQNGYAYDDNFIDPEQDEYSDENNEHTNDVWNVLQDPQQVDIFKELVDAVRLVGGNFLLQDCDGWSAVDWSEYLCQPDTYMVRPRHHTDSMATLLDDTFTPTQHQAA